MRLLTGFIIVVFFTVGETALAQDKEYREDGRIVKARAEWFWKRRSVNGVRPLKHLVKVREDVARYMKSLQKSQAASIWQPVGPQAITGTGYHDYSGRSLAVAVSYADTNTVLLGTAGGGIWKSTDGGLNWSPKSDNLGSLAISCFAQHPTDANIWYAGTGEPSFNADYISGIGVLKSTDGGETWTALNLLSDALTHISGIVINKNNPDIVVVANYFNESDVELNGIYRSVNGGASWSATNLVGTEYRPSGIVGHPVDNDTMYAVLGRTIPPNQAPNQNGIWKSTNAGATWFLLASGAPGAQPGGLPNLRTQGGKSSMAISATNPMIMYGLFANGIDNSNELIGSDSGMFKSTNGGLNWFNANLPDQSSGGLSFFAGQGFYDIYTAIHPGNSNIVFAGGIDLLRTTNGGTTWQNVTTGYTSNRKFHPDQQGIGFNPVNPNTIYVVGDGGIMKSYDAGVTLVDLNPTLQITQFTGLAVSATDTALILGGSQDNGTELASSGNLSWTLVSDGDGGYTAIDPTNPNIQYSQRFHVQGEDFSQLKTTSRWSSETFINSGLDKNDRSEFYVPFTMDPNDPSTLYLGTFRMYKTTNGGTSWSAVSGDLTAQDPFTITSVSVSSKDSRYVAAGTFDGTIALSTNSGSTWTSIDNISTMPLRPVSDIVFDPNDPGRIYATFQGYSRLVNDTRGHVWRTANQGASWTNITGDLPDVPVNALVVDPQNIDRLVVGTDAGLFQTLNGGTTWTPYNEGFPSGAVVVELIHHEASGLLFASTHGRGAFKRRWTDSSDFVPPLPTSFELFQNIPNPFNPSTLIPFNLTQAQFVTIDIYNVLGHRVRRLAEQNFDSGYNTVAWDGLDDRGRAVTSGVYIYRVKTPTTTQSKKMLLLR